ncbi:MAG: glycosyltransferase [Magnetococcus sp. DMHC-6]
MMNAFPVTVLTSVFNGAVYLDAAIASILAQSFTNFEFILIDDASTDATPHMLAKWARRDARIVLVRNDSNMGLTRSLNKGLLLARGEWIARQDADDISMPQRLEKQLAFLANHPEVGILGTGIIVIDNQGNKEQKSYINPTNHTAICWRLLSDNPFFHTSVIFRRELVLECPYDITWRFGQDFDLWRRLLQRTKGANLPKPLVYYRCHTDRVSIIHGQQQQHISLQIAQQQCTQLLPNLSLSMQEILAIRMFIRSVWPIPEETLLTCVHVLKLFRAFCQQNGLDNLVLDQLRDRLLQRLWRTLFYSLSWQDGLKLIKEMWLCGRWKMLTSLGREIGRIVLQRRIVDDSIDSM